MDFPYPPAPFPQERGGIRGLASLRPALGLIPKQGCFGCLPKVLHDAKPTEQATLNTHFQKLYRFIDSLKYDCLVKQPYFMKILIEKSVFFCNSLSLRNAIYGADGSAEMTAYAL